MPEVERVGEEDTAWESPHPCNEVHTRGTLSVVNQIHYTLPQSDGEVREWTEELPVQEPMRLPSEGREAFQCALHGSAERHQVDIVSVAITN